MLTTAQAAEIAGVDPATLRHEIRNGHLPAYKPSPRVILIHRDDLDAWRKSPARSSVGKRGRPRRSTQVETDDNLLTIVQAAAVAEVDPSTLRRAIRKGRLPANTTNPRAVLIQRDDLAAWVKDSQNSSAGKRGRPLKITRSQPDNN